MYVKSQNKIYLRILEIVSELKIVTDEYSIALTQENFLN